MIGLTPLEKTGLCPHLLYRELKIYLHYACHKW